MWSLGCIIAELHTGYPLFPGENEVEQLACIMEIFGLPPHDLLEKAQRKRLFFDSKGQARSLTNSKGKKRRPSSKDLIRSLKSNDVLFTDFVRRCLDWDPMTRLTPDEAVHHPWVAEGRHSSRTSSRKQVRQTLPSPQHNTVYEYYNSPDKPPQYSTEKTRSDKPLMSNNRTSETNHPTFFTVQTPRKHSHISEYPFNQHHHHGGGVSGSSSDNMISHTYESRDNEKRSSRDSRRDSFLPPIK